MEELLPDGSVLLDAITIAIYMLPTGAQGIVVRTSDMTMDKALGTLEAAKFELWGTMYKRQLESEEE